MKMPDMSDNVDCAVIGGGPAGLTAAIYLARYHLSVLVFDDGMSRALKIPVSHNHAGIPDGIGGTELLSRIRTQALKYGAHICSSRVQRLERSGQAYVVHCAADKVRTKNVLLATGVINRRPAMSEDQHDDAVARGLLRYCPVCDGYEVTDACVAVFGAGAKGFNEALFLRSYSKDITLVSPHAEHGLTDEQMEKLSGLGIKVHTGPSTSIEPRQGAIRLHSDGRTHAFASVYPALGSDVRSALASDVGADLSNEGCVIVDRQQRSSVPGLYAAGDVVIGLDQISSAMGQAGVAATAMRNELYERAPLTR
jgi:thioredoxin reductase (NADPH)